MLTYIWGFTCNAYIDKGMRRGGLKALKAKTHSWIVYATPASVFQTELIGVSNQTLLEYMDAVASDVCYVIFLLAHPVRSYI